MATHYSTLAWGIPWTEEPGEPQSTGSQSQTQFTHTHRTDTHTHTKIIVDRGNKQVQTKQVKIFNRKKQPQK